MARARAQIESKMRGNVLPGSSRDRAPGGVAGRGGQGASVVLASTSARRRQLLEDACAARGVAWTWLDPGVDDGLLRAGSTEPASFCAALAYFKAAAGRQQLRRAAQEGAIVLGADTICVAQDQIIGKPVDASDARRTISRFVNAEHDVFTGVAILRDDAREIVVDRARVRIGGLDRASIDEYVASGEWRGKAGAYNLFDRLDAGWPIEFRGDPTTIVGLPMGIVHARVLDRVPALGGAA